MRNWLFFGIGVLLFVLVPFFLWEEPIERWVNTAMASPESRVTLAWTLGGLLASDIVLPVPSSVIATASGAFFGLAGGTLINWLGMNVGCGIGYWLGRRAGRPAADRLIGRTELQRADQSSRRLGAWSIVLFRAVPVLAEASVLLAGTVGMPWSRFAIVSMAANLAVSLLYAGVGSLALNGLSFVGAFAAACLVPGAALWLTRSR